MHFIKSAFVKWSRMCLFVVAILSVIDVLWSAVSHQCDCVCMCCLYGPQLLSSQPSSVWTDMLLLNFFVCMSVVWMDGWFLKGVVT